MEIIPDFRQAQRKITAWFEAQKNNIKVPVDFKVDEQAAQKARTATQRVQRDITEDTRKQVFDREQMYARMFDQIEKQEQAAAREQSKIREQALREQVKAQEQTTRELNKAHEQALREQARLDQQAARIQEQLRRDEIRTQEQAERELNKAHEQGLREQARMDQQAARVQEQLRRDAIRTQQQLEREINQAHAEGLREQARLDRDADRERLRVQKSLQKDMERIGGEHGAGVAKSLVQNFQREVRSRASFITAVLAGVLIAGAPTFLGAATVLFGGLGLAVTAQSEKVKSAWRATWQSVLKDTRAAAADFTGVHERLAANTAATVQALRPVLARAFDAAAPLTEDFGNALLRATSTLIPGFTRAIEGSTPVMRGFDDLLQGTAVGLNGFFDALVNEAPAAGSAVSSLGALLEQLLPAIGEILAIGSTLASSLLPLLVGVFGLLNTVLQATGPALGLVAAGFTAMRAGSFLVGILTALATRLTVIGNTANFAAAGLQSAAGIRGAGALSTSFGRAGAAASSMATNIGKASVALPILGAVIAYFAGAKADATSEEDRWAEAILAGGKASTNAYNEYKSGSSWATAASEATGLASSWDDAKDRAEELREQMTPLELAQTNARAAQADLTTAIQEYGTNSDEAADATAANADAQTALAAEQRKVNEGLRDSVTSAEAAKTALEDYNQAIQLGDTNGAAEAIYRYKTETAEAAQEQRIFNAAVADTIPSADAAKAAMDDLANALRNRDAVGAAEALGRFRTQTAEAADEQATLEIQLYGTTQAFEDQRDKVLAATDSAFAMRQAELDVQSALEDLNGTLADSESSTQDVEQANLNYEQSLFDAATAAGQLAADALPATASALEETRAKTDASLQYLYRLRDQMGTAFPASLATTISSLEETQASFDTTSTEAVNLRNQVNSIPTARAITVTADIGQARQTLVDFMAERWEAKINATVVGEGTTGGGGTTRRMATGGLLDGPGTGTSDSILGIDRNTGVPTAWVSNREYVVNALATSQNLKLIEAINAGRVPSNIDPSDLARLAGGGMPFNHKATVHYTTDLGDSRARMQSVIAGAEARATAALSGTAGSGSAGGSGWQAIWNWIKARVPFARINSTYRPGDPGYHGKGKAVDLGFGVGPGGNGSAGLALINRTLHDGIGSNLAELIYDGLGDDRPDLKFGRPLTYSAATRAEHHNHVHAAVADWGGVLMPGLNMLMNDTGGPEYLSNNTAAINGFRDMLGKSGGLAMPRFDVTRFDGAEGGKGEVTSVTGFVNNGQIIVADMNEFAQKAEVSKRASLASLGLL